MTHGIRLMNGMSVCVGTDVCFTKVSFAPLAFLTHSEERANPIPELGIAAGIPHNTFQAAHAVFSKSSQPILAFAGTYDLNKLLSAHGALLPIVTT